MRLPPLSSLLAFEATARLASFTAAARALNVTQPAVSRRIALLEADLGVGLVSRRTRPLQLTDAGARLYEALRSAFGRIEQTVEDIRAEADVNRIEISAGSGFASFWLIPRFAALQARFPAPSIRILTLAHRDDMPAGDIQIRFGDGHWPGYRVLPIMGEEVFAVASPVLRPPEAGPLTVAELTGMRLLRLQGAGQPWYDWQTWFAALGAVRRPKLKLVEFDSYALLVTAALAGQGIGLCWGGLLDTFLDSGALVRVSAASVSSERGYYVTHRADVPAASPVRGIADWIVAAASPSARA